jgi:hypothetical protein
MEPSRRGIVVGVFLPDSPPVHMIRARVGESQGGSPSALRAIAAHSSVSHGEPPSITTDCSRKLCLLVHNAV